MSTITRIFPSARRDTAFGVLRGMLVVSQHSPARSGAGSQSIILAGNESSLWTHRWGLAAFILTARHVPILSVHVHRFDILGVALSAVGIFCLVFGVQEGHASQWGQIVGPITVPQLIALGVLAMVGCIVWQRLNPGEPLMPLHLFSGS